MAKVVMAEVGSIKTSNKKMAEMLSCAQAVAETDMNVLICGETGTGRDSLAEAVQFMSGRIDEPFYVLRCGSIEGEKDIDDIRRGTTYLDDIHRLNLGMQKKLLVKLRDNGDGIRIISSAVPMLDDMMKRGRFYVSLYNILAKVRLDIPPLRERCEDIVSMVRDAVKKYNRKYQKQVRLEPGAAKLLRMYRYPGNIDELDCIIQRAVLINKSGVIKSNSIMSVLDMENVVFATLVKGTNLEFNQEINRLGKELIINSLMDTGSIRKAANQLSLNHVTLWNKCNALGIDVDKFTNISSNSSVQKF